MDLTPNQRDAVEYIGKKNLIIDACAGSGKTRVLTERVKHLVRSGISPDNIFVGTFTRAAANEMGERICTGEFEGTTFGHLGTLHSFGRLVLMRHYGKQFSAIPNRGSIMNPGDVTKLMGYLLAEGDTWNTLGRGIATEYEMDPKMVHRYASQISGLKNSLVLPEVYEIRRDAHPGVAELWKAYEAAKANGDLNPKVKVAHRLFDMDDMLSHVYFLLKNNPKLLAPFVAQFKYLLIDEAQDCNLAQYMLIKMLAGGVNHITLVGDADQSMYGFRGALPSEFIAWAGDSQVIPLGINFRSLAPIVDAAAKLISHNTERLPKEITAHSTV